eukprot:scaffold4.g4895.t1
MVGCKRVVAIAAVLALAYMMAGDAAAQHLNTGATQGRRLQQSTDALISDALSQAMGAVSQAVDAASLGASGGSASAAIDSAISAIDKATAALASSTTAGTGAGGGLVDGLATSAVEQMKQLADDVASKKITVAQFQSAAGKVREDTLYGVYDAGVQSGDIPDLARATRPVLQSLVRTVGDVETIERENEKAARAEAAAEAMRKQEADAVRRYNEAQEFAERRREAHKILVENLVGSILLPNGIAEDLPRSIWPEDHPSQDDGSLAATATGPASGAGSGGSSGGRLTGSDSGIIGE